MEPRNPFAKHWAQNGQTVLWQILKYYFWKQNNLPDGTFIVYGSIIRQGVRVPMIHYSLEPMIAATVGIDGTGVYGWLQQNVNTDEAEQLGGQWLSFQEEWTSQEPQQWYPSHAGPYGRGTPVMNSSGTVTQIVLPNNATINYTYIVLDGQVVETSMDALWKHRFSPEFIPLVTPYCNARWIPGFRNNDGDGGGDGNFTTNAYGNQAQMGIPMQASAYSSAGMGAHGQTNGTTHTNAYSKMLYSAVDFNKIGTSDYQKLQWTQHDIKVAAEARAKVFKSVLQVVHVVATVAAITAFIVSTHGAGAPVVTAGGGKALAFAAAL